MILHHFAFYALPPFDLLMMLEGGTCACPWFFLKRLLKCLFTGVALPHTSRPQLSGFHGRPQLLTCVSALATFEFYAFNLIHFLEQF